MRITELCSFKIFDERSDSSWDSNTPFPIPAAYIPPEPSMIVRDDDDDDDDDDDVDHGIGSTETNSSEFSDTDKISEGRFSLDLIREANKPDEADAVSIPDLPDSDFSGFSDPRYPEPKPSSVFSKSELKPDLVRFSEPVFPDPEDQPETEKPATPEPPKPKPDPPQLQELSSPEPEISGPSQSDTKSGFEPASPVFEIFVFLLILLVIVAIIVTVWTNLHIFLPIFILAFAAIKIRERWA